NLIALPVAAMGLLSPTVAGAAMAASSISVVLNAFLLTRWKPHLPDMLVPEDSNDPCRTQETPTQRGDKPETPC
ncbi:MAG: hypothetical protein JXQ84_10280, partial [Rhodospirillaceae bacterium]|nr:hypothetical protein [Rhodospirillaceae bacterium]